MDTTEKIARFVVETDFKAIPREAIDKAKQSIIDTVGIALAGYREEGGRIVTRVIRELGGKGENRIIVDGLKVQVTEAAFAHGAMAEFLDYGDSYNAPTSHPSCTTVPVVLALGEKLRASGKEIIQAYVLGMEVGGKVGFGAWPLVKRDSGWSPIKYLGSLQTAMAAAKMLKLNSDQASVALAIVTTGSGALMSTFWSMIKGVHSGDAARSGIMAAMLAREGFTGVKNVIELESGFADAYFGKGNYNLDKMTDNLGNPYHIVNPGLDLKKYPCCFGTQWSLDALIPLLKEHNIAYEDIESVALVTPAQQVFLDRTDPQTEIECKFSLPYVIGATILDGKPEIDTFHEPRIFSQRQREAMKKVKITHSPAATARSAEWVNDVIVKLKNGKEYKKSVGFPTPLGLDDIITKYRECAQLVLPSKQVERSLEIMLNLEKLEDATLLMDALMAKAP